MGTKLIVVIAPIQLISLVIVLMKNLLVAYDHETFVILKNFALFLLTFLSFLHFRRFVDTLQCILDVFRIIPMLKL